MNGGCGSAYSDMREELDNELGRRCCVTEHVDDCRNSIAALVRGIEKNRYNYDTPLQIP